MDYLDITMPYGLGFFDFVQFIVGKKFTDYFSGGIRVLQTKITNVFIH